MAATKGRNLALRWNSVLVAGVREKSIALNGEPIDITSDDDAGWQALIDNESGVDSVEVTVSGVLKNQSLLQDWLAKTRTRQLSLTHPEGYVISGMFNLGNMTITGTYNEAATFEATFMSNGPVVFTP